MIRESWCLDYPCRLILLTQIICFSSAAIAQNDKRAAPEAAVEEAALQDIVVVARKRQENAQSVPVSITALTNSGLRDRGIARVADLVGSVPNLVQDGGGSVLGALGLRGIVSQTRNIGFDSGLGVYVDGVLVVRPSGADQELPDVAMVEVLRGPQGTLFGRNTTAGAINITTRKADLQGFALDGRLAAGNLGQREGSLFVTGPLIQDRLGIKIAGSISKRDGYLHNVVDDKHYNGVNRKTVRGGLYWKPADTIDVALSGSYLRQDDSLVLGQVVDNSSGLLAGLPGYFNDPYLTAQDAPNRQTRDIWTTNLNIDWTVGNHTITSITAYGDNKSHTQDDDDVRPIPLAASDFHDGARQFTQEVRVASRAGGAFDYVGGLYYLRQKADSNRATLIFGPPSPAAFFGAISSTSFLRTDAFAVFGSVNWRPLPRVIVSGGLRYGRETKRLNFTQRNGSFVPLPDLGPVRLRRRDADVSGNATLSYEVAPKALLYAGVARGFKSGGFNPDIVGDTDISFGPESAWTYEAGIKSDLLDRRLRVNASAYYTEYADLQVSALTGAAFQIRNAAAARIKGIELEIAARPVHAIELDLGLGYTDAAYKHFPGCAPLTDCAGNRLPNVPKWTANGGVQISQSVGSGEIRGRTDILYRSNVFYEATNAPDGNLPGYTLVNARLGYRAAQDRWGLAVFAKNLFDKRYREFSLFLAPFEQRQDRYAVPRTYGVELTTHW